GIDTSRATDAIADVDCVRFTVFFEVRGLQVVEITADALRKRFGARGRSADSLLSAYAAHAEAIVRVARRIQPPERRSVIRLTAADFNPLPPAATQSDVSN